MTLSATVGKRPSEEELAQQTFEQQPNGQDEDAFNRAPKRQGEGLVERTLGLSVLPMTPQIARQLGVGEATQGLVVNAVDPSSDGGTKGLQRGDVLLSANYRNIKTVAELETAVREAQKSSRAAILLRVQRRGQPATYLPVRIR